jgi:hypothetical protein
VSKESIAKLLVNKDTLGGVWQLDMTVAMWNLVQAECDRSGWDGIQKKYASIWSLSTYLLLKQLLNI